MITRGHLLDQLGVIASSEPDRLALNYDNEVILSFGDFFSSAQTMAQCLTQDAFQEGCRIGVIGLSDELLYPYAVAIMDRFSLILLDDYEMDDEIKLLEYDFDYLLTMKNNQRIIDLAHSMSIPLILVGDTIEWERSSTKDHRQTKAMYGVMTSSGTTAVPKLIVSSYDSLIATINQQHQLYGYNSSTHYAQTSPFRRMGTLKYFLYVLYWGGSSYIYTLDFNRIYRSLQTNPITVLRMVPSTLEKFIEYLKKNKNGTVMHSLKYVTSGGAHLPTHLYGEVASVFKTELIHTYGSTETGNVATTYNLPHGSKLGSVGTIRFHDYKLVEGQLFVKGPSLFSGYLNQTSEDPFTDGWYNTGDLARVDDDGELFITGRTKELINRGGEKISPVLIEQAIHQLDLFAEAVVFPYLVNGQEEVALVVVEKHRSVQLEELRDLLKTKFASTKLPTRYFVAAAIPKNEQGKVERQKLHTHFRDDAVASLQDLTEDDAITQKVYQHWQSMFKHKQIGLNSDFYNVGGDSLKAAELVCALENEFDTEFVLLDFLKHRSLIDMARYIQSQMKPKRFKFLECLKEGDPYQEPLIFFYSASGSSATYIKLAQQIQTDRSIYAVTFNTEIHAGESNVECIIHDYLSEIEMLTNSNRYYFAGLSIGGRIALETAYYLGLRQKEVTVFMLDTVFVPENMMEKLTTIYYKTRYSLSYDFRNLSLMDSLKTIARNIRTALTRILFSRQDLDSRPKRMTNESKSDLESSSNDLAIHIKHLFGLKTRDFYPIHLIYFFAKKGLNVVHSNHIKNRVKTFEKREIDCFHGDFVTTRTEETARLIEDFMNKS